MNECMTNSGVVALFVVIVIMYQLTAIQYFIRILLCYLHSIFVKKKLDVLATSTYSSICLTSDVDILLFHMNNARYIRELDFARADFYTRTKLWKKVREHGGEVYQGGISIRYRKFIRLFALYSVRSRIVYWDQGAIYMEHRFVTKSDNFVRAIAYGQQKVIKCDAEMVLADMLRDTSNKNAAKGRGKPECPPEIRLWIESINVSKNNLRPNSV